VFQAYTIPTEERTDVKDTSQSAVFIHGCNLTVIVIKELTELFQFLAVLLINTFSVN